MSPRSLLQLVQQAYIYSRFLFARNQSTTTVSIQNWITFPRFEATLNIFKITFLFELNWCCTSNLQASVWGRSGSGERITSLVYCWEASWPKTLWRMSASLLKKKRKHGHFGGGEKVVVGGMAPCPYTLCCFCFENSEWSFSLAFCIFSWLRRLPSRSKERRTWTVTRRRQMILHWLAKGFQGTRSCPESSDRLSTVCHSLLFLWIMLHIVASLVSTFTGTLGWHHWQRPAATSSARKGAPIFRAWHGDALKIPVVSPMDDLRRLGGHPILRHNKGINVSVLVKFYKNRSECTSKMWSPRYWMLPIMFEMRTERLLGIQWNRNSILESGFLHSTWTNAYTAISFPRVILATSFYVVYLIFQVD